MRLFVVINEAPVFLRKPDYPNQDEPVCSYYGGNS